MMMTANIRRIAFALVVCALLGTSALAGGKKSSVTINADVTVGDTVVKKGNYDVTFDEQTEELKILKGDKVVAQTKARMEESKSVGKYKPTYTTVKDAQGTKLLASIALGGKYAVVSNEKVAAAMAEATRGTQ